jgi:cobalt-zinc-cadmium efflux system membrane fusion protein
MNKTCILALLAALLLIGCSKNGSPDGTRHEDAHAHDEAPAHGDEAPHGIRVAPAVAGVIADEHEVQGLLTPVEGRIAQVPRASPARSAPARQRRRPRARRAGAGHGRKQPQPDHYT